MIATVMPIIRAVLGIVGASFLIRDPRSASMLHEPCLGNSIASAQRTIISLLPDSMTADSMWVLLARSNLCALKSFRRPAGQLPFFPDLLWNSAFDRAFAYL